MVFNFLKSLQQTLFAVTTILCNFTANTQVCNKTEFISLDAISYSGNGYNENYISKQFANTIYIIKTGNIPFLIQTIGSFDTLWQVDLNTNTTSYKLIQHDKLKKGDKDELGRDFFLTEKALYVLGNGELYVYNKKDENCYEFVKKINLGLKYSYILGKINNNLFFFEAFNYHPKDQEEKVIISKYSLESNAIVKSIFPEMRGIELTYSNKRFCDIHRETLLYAQPFSNNITIYNENLDSITSIHVNQTIDTVKIKTKEYSTDEVQRILLNDVLYNRNIKIDVVGDTLLSIYKKKHQNFRTTAYYDMYVYKDDKWSLIDTARLITFDFDSTQQITSSMELLPYIVDNNQLILHNGFIYEVNNTFIERDPVMTYKDYNDARDKAYFYNVLKLKLQKQPVNCLFNDD
ncbi:MAG TPA: hypothetical protein VEC12_11090 [Bacteroidia bacterium]|nr:hypothetical protein [Bacteroidia bacterium]